MRYALNELGEWVCAATETKKKGAKFYCECPDKHRVKLRKPSGVLGKRPFEDHFAHLPDVNNFIPTCRGGGESDEHKLAKHLLRIHHGSYSFDMFRCKTCRYVEQWVGDTGHVELELRSSDGRWRYDCVVMDEVPVMALEVYHTHKTSDDKVRGTKMPVAEFVAHEVIDCGAKGQLRNLMVVMGTCERCLKTQTQRGQWEAWNSERNQVISSHMQVEQEWFAIARREEDARRQEIRERMEFYKRMALLPGQYKTAYKAQWKEEINQWKQWDSIISEGWRSWVDFTQLIDGLKSKTRLEYALEILMKYGCNIEIYRKCGITRKIGEDVRKLRFGILSKKDGYNIYIGIVTDNTFEYVKALIFEANFNNVSGTSIWFINVNYLLNQSNQLWKGEVKICDCKWPILKQFEAQKNICASCFKFGHHSENCHINKKRRY